MDKEKFFSLLGTRRLGRSFEYFESIDSTNDLLMRQAARLPDGFAAAAGEQLGGKGRLGRRWAAPAGSSLLMSVLLKPAEPLATPSLLPLACGLAEASALRELTGADIMLKWPNDIILSGKKLGGILCESRVSEREKAYVCGFGLNLSQTQEFFAGEYSGGASIKMLCGEAPGSEETAAALLGKLEDACDMLWGGGEIKLLEEYSRLCVTLGKKVRASGTEKNVYGTARAIGADGSLVIDTPAGPERVYAADVSVRVQGGYV
jgi:BirA family biotin operon repressor/biotin-[acetyl-CoA-carboxylase] ligase